jgi:hypothetical protein
MAVEGNRDGTGSSDQGGVGDDELDTGPDSGSVGEQEALERRAAALAEDLRLRAAVLAALSERPPSPPGDSAAEGDEVPDTISQIENIKITQQSIQEIRSATLDNGGLNPSVVERLRNPEEGLVDISDPDVRLSLDLYLAVTNASEATYKGCRDAILRRYPESGVLSYYSVRKLVSDISGVVSVSDDMCINSCHAFTGPFAHLDSCSMCGEPRYDPHQLLLGKNVPRQKQCTILLGPQLQARRRSEQGSSDMSYLGQKMASILQMLDSLPDGMDFEYDDSLCGGEFITMNETINLTINDTIVALSLDAAQLYQNKKSDTWIAIWMLHNLCPDRRYKKRCVLPCTTIPGPNKPKIIDSYLFRALHHLSALQRENNGRGLRVWDAASRSVVESRILFSLGMADAPGLTEMDGRVGHHGAQGCRLGCDMKGRHKPSSGHYYAAHLKPNHYTIADCNHPDIDIRNLSPISTEHYQAKLAKLIASTDQTDYEKNRKETGISKPSIFSALVERFTFPVPRCFSLDLMHLLFINLGELLIPLWRGTIK